MVQAPGKAAAFSTGYSICFNNSGLFCYFMLNACILGRNAIHVR